MQYTKRYIAFTLILLIGFILKFADKDSRIFHLACNLAREAYSFR